jgi:NADH-quinone oxidoreductase subunit G
VARVSAATAEGLGVADGAVVTVSTDRGAVSAPVLVTEMPDGVVWLPTNAAGVPVRRELAARPGSVVRLAVAAGGLEQEATA